MEILAADVANFADVVASARRPRQRDGVIETGRAGFQRRIAPPNSRTPRSYPAVTATRQRSSQRRTIVHRLARGRAGDAGAAAAALAGADRRVRSRAWRSSWSVAPQANSTIRRLKRLRRPLRRASDVRVCAPPRCRRWRHQRTRVVCRPRRRATGNRRRSWADIDRQHAARDRVNRRTVEVVVQAQPRPPGASTGRSDASTPSEAVAVHADGREIVEGRGSFPAAWPAENTNAAINGARNGPSAFPAPSNRPWM